MAIKTTLLVALALGLLSPARSWCQSGLERVSPAEQYLQAAADRDRAALNLPPLRRDPALVAAARQHAWQMVQHNTISHQFAHEPDLAARGSAAGARFSRISENVAESPNAIRIHEAWMNSEGHRHNLLDTSVDSVGIAVIARAGQLFAVEDFSRSVRPMSISQQENSVAAVVAGRGIGVESSEYARRACEESGGAAGRAGFVMRYTTADIKQIPEQLVTQIATGKYARAAVGACSAASGNGFSMYSLAVLLYRN